MDRRDLLLTGLRLGIPALIEIIQTTTGETYTEEEVRAAFLHLSNNLPPKFQLPPDFPPHSRDLPDAT